MDQLLNLFGLFALFAALSFGGTWLVSMRLRRQTCPGLEPGAILRLRCASGVYRSMVLEASASGWIVSAPLQRDSYVALRKGESMIVEAADAQGAYLFRSEIIARDADTHRLTLAKPVNVRRIERRGCARTRARTAVPASLDGHQARVVDLSELGARVATRARVGRGERVRLDLEGRDGPLFGWVLDTVPGSLYGYDSAEVRLRFEQELSTV